MPDISFVSARHSNIIVSEFDVGRAKLGHMLSRRKKQVNSETVAKRWGIDPKKAKHTVRGTTKQDVRSTLHPTLRCRFPTNDGMMAYRRLPHAVYSDTLISGLKSKRDNKYAQVFCTSYVCTRCHPMHRKSEAHKALFLVSKCNGIPPNIIIDNSKEQTQGTFEQKARKVG